jgi:hypothetical protein
MAMIGELRRRCGPAKRRARANSCGDDVVVSQAARRRHVVQNVAPPYRRDDVMPLLDDDRVTGRRAMSYGCLVFAVVDG